MKPLDIYKYLPKKNCGECVPRTCMSFAVSLGGNPDYLEQCRHVGDEDRDRIASMLVKGDWRDELVRSLGEEVSRLDLALIAPGIGGSMREDKLVIRCIGQEYLVGGNGGVSPDTRNPWIKILLLHYVKNRGNGEFAGRWISFSELKGGFVKASTFQRECEEPLRNCVDADPEGVASVLKALGASEAGGFTADYAWALDLLPKVRALLLYRHGDEEFPSSLQMLFDAVTGEFIDVETLIFLCEGLVHTLTRATRS